MAKKTISEEMKSSTKKKDYSENLNKTVNIRKTLQDIKPTGINDLKETKQVTEKLINDEEKKMSDDEEEDKELSQYSPEVLSNPNSINKKKKPKQSLGWLIILILIIILLGVGYFYWKNFGLPFNLTNQVSQITNLNHQDQDNNLNSNNTSSDLRITNFLDNTANNSAENLTPEISNQITDLDQSLNKINKVKNSIDLPDFDFDI